MIRLKLSEIAGALESALIGQDAAIESIVTDSRKVRYGSLFAALPGSQVDGHDFAESAVRLGASGLLLSRRLPLEVPQIIVADVLRALGSLACFLRERAGPRVVGITGSNGKTTVKEMVAAILAREGEVLATHGNYNNELGVPLSLFAIEARHRFAVLEMGASKSGDIAYLANIAKPDVGLVTNVGPAHLKGFGSVEGVARAKGEIYTALPETGCAVFNADEPWLAMWQTMNSAARSLTFGVGDDCDVRLQENQGEARLLTPDGVVELELALPGRHNRLNAAAAAATALALGVEAGQIEQGLRAVKPVPGRLNLLKTQAGWTVIDDTYNANPASLYSALQVLSSMQGQPWLVLGDMKELGEGSQKMHREVGENARAMGVRRLFTTGPLARHTADAFGKGATHFEDRDALSAALADELRSGVICLVKGSRSMGMEAVVRAITGKTGMKEAC